jgi:hypothetical protein
VTEDAIEFAANNVGYVVTEDVIEFAANNVGYVVAEDAIEFAANICIAVDNETGGSVNTGSL